MLSLILVFLPFLSFPFAVPAEVGDDCRLRHFKIHEYRNECPVSEERFEECPRDDVTLDMCCRCYEVCCSGERNQANDGTGIIFPRSTAATGGATVISLTNSTLDEDAGGGDRRNVSTPNAAAVMLDIAGGSRAISHRIRRNTASKTNRGTGEDVVVDDDEDGEKRNRSSVRKELEETITRAVRIALNKLANTLKNVTEMEDSGRNDNDTLTTVAPSVESCSSKSKRCDEPEPDLLDEFFPPKNHGRGGVKGIGRRRKRQVVLPFPKVGEVRNGADFGSSGGLIAKGEVMEKTTTSRVTATAVDTESTTSDPMESTTMETVTEKAKPPRPSKRPPPTTKVSPGNSTQNQTNRQGNHTAEAWRQGQRNKTEEVQGSGPKPKLVSSSLLVPKVRPGRCETLTGNKTCVALLPDASQCSGDSECEGTKKCCFYGCKPYDEVGICSLPVLF